MSNFQFGKVHAVPLGHSTLDIGHRTSDIESPCFAVLIPEVKNEVQMMNQKNDNEIPVLLFLIIAIATSITCSLVDPSFYSKILGDINPILLFSVSGVLAYLSFPYIKKFGLSFISDSLSVSKLLSYCSISILLGGMPVLIDLWQPFPRDINVLLPESLLYYPTIGVLAEIIFHLLPITLLLLIFRSWMIRHAWVLIILVATVEPVFQVVFGMGPNGIGLRDILVFSEVFIFGMVQVRAFLKYGFLAMYSCRIGFYLTWHFIWGAIRLGVI